MENMKRILVLLTVVAMLFVADSIAEEAAPEKSALVLDQTSITMDYSQTVTLTTTNGGEYARWTSSDEGVVWLNANGGESVEVMGVNVGKAMITCTSGEQQQSCEVTVTAPGTLEIVNVDYPSTYRMAGGGWKLRRGVLASNVDLATLTTVLKDANGTIIGSAYTHTFDSGVRRYELKGLDYYVPFSWIGAEGAYTWTLSATDAIGRMVSVNLPINAVAEGKTAISNEPGTQSPVIIVSEIALNSAKISMQKGETRWLSATVAPENALNRDVIWASDDPSVAVVSADGEVTAVGIGIVTITCYTLGNSAVSASCEVTVLGDQASGDGRNLIADTATPVELAPMNSGEAGDNYNFATYTVAVGKLTQGEVYCLSADVEITEGSFDHVTVALYDLATSTTQAENQLVPIVNGHIATTIETTGADAEKLLIYAGKVGETRGNGMRIRNLKLEKGSEPTEWSPAPEDSEALSGGRGDGRNLIAGTATPVELAPRNSGEAGDNYNFATYTITVGKLEQGAIYTVSADVEVTAGSCGELSIFFYNAAIDTQQTEKASFAIVDGHVTAKVKITGTDAERMLIYAGKAGETRGNGVRITNLKLEKGSFPTEWSPAPEDGAA